MVEVVEVLHSVLHAVSVVGQDHHFAGRHFFQLLP
jgi:hypothetical protein